MLPCPLDDGKFSIVSKSKQLLLMGNTNLLLVIMWKLPGNHPLF